jgi:hypothetical protein
MADDLVEAAFVGDEHHAAMIQALLEEHEIPSLQQQVAPSGQQLGYGLMTLGSGARRIMVHAHRLEEARAVIAEFEVADEEVAEPVNARYLEEAQGGRKLRDYGLFGAYARMLLVSFGVMGTAFVVYLLSRAL